MCVGVSYTVSFVYACTREHARARVYQSIVSVLSTGQATWRVWLDWCICIGRGAACTVSYGCMHARTRAGDGDTECLPAAVAACAHACGVWAVWGGTLVAVCCSVLRWVAVIYAIYVVGCDKRILEQVWAGTDRCVICCSFGGDTSDVVHAYNDTCVCLSVRVCFCASAFVRVLLCMCTSVRVRVRVRVHVRVRVCVRERVCVCVRVRVRVRLPVWRCMCVCTKEF